MANYNPPLENLPIFDNAMFIHADIPITQADADKRYLRFPNAQGTENLLTINVAGLASMLSGMDIVDGTNKTNIDQSGANITIDNNVNNGTLIYKANNGAGVETSILSLNSTTGSLTTTGTTTLTSTDLTLTTTNPPTCSATQPASNDSSTKVPTTAWVQSAISLVPAPSTLLSSNNTWTGTNAFNNVAPITSTAIQPPNNDSSTIIPTTAWVQSAITFSNQVITGTIIAFAGASVPVGYVKCDATPLSTATYPALFGVLGYTYGGSGGTFYPPNLLNKFIQGSTSSAGGSTSGNFTVSNNNIQLANVTSTTPSGNIPIALNTPSGISNWSMYKGKASGDGSANQWTPVTNSSSANGSNLVDAFTTPVGVSTPTPLIGTVPSLLMQYIIKT